MFNIGVGEILIVLVVAFVIVGPDDLPKVARWLGRQVRRPRTTRCARPSGRRKTPPTRRKARIKEAIT